MCGTRNCLASWLEFDALSTCAIEVPVSDQGHRVVVKVLSGLQGKPPGVLKALQQDAVVMCQLRHPNLARTFGKGVLAGQPWACGMRVCD
jgi:hypothetical protein